MSNVRLIARLDIKGSNLIKGVRFEGFRVLGDPQEFAKDYYEKGIDELIYMDTVASLYGRNSLRDLVERTTQNVFIPLTVGGGIRSTDDVKELLRAGADKVAVNTAAVKRPELIKEISRKFGSQCMVLSIEACRRSSSSWEAYTDNGREHSGKDVIEWAKQGVELGAGEILLTSVDRDGTRNGFDTDLIRKVSTVVPIPVIASGGMGKVEHILSMLQHTEVGAVAMAHVLHYKLYTLDKIRNSMLDAGLEVRHFKTN